jgi:hypothetical protein
MKTKQSRRVFCLFLFQPESSEGLAGEVDAINSCRLRFGSRIKSRKKNTSTTNEHQLRWKHSVQAENWCCPISIKRKQRAIKLNSFNYSSCRSRLFEFIWEHKFPSWSFFFAERLSQLPFPHHHLAHCMFTWYLIACYLNKLVYFPFNRKIKTF